MNDQVSPKDSSENSPKDPSRREAMKTALKAGAYAAPVILAASVPTPVSAQVTGPTGTLSGQVVNAQTAAPIPGATVSVSGGPSATTDNSGNYTISNAPAGSRTITTSASGFSTRTDMVNIVAGSTTTFNTSLVPTTVGTGIAIVLTWGAQPSDLDSHLVGPDGSGGRFHCYYGDSSPVPFATLDIDDTSAFGPETITVSQVSGSYIAGSYSYYVRNYSGSPAFDVSGAVITVFAAGAQVAQYQVSAATGNPADRIWSVFGFTLTPSGAGASITPVQQIVPDASAPTIASGPAKR